jgi:hypothetical protein
MRILNGRQRNFLKSMMLSHGEISLYGFPLIGALALLGSALQKLEQLD